MLSKQHGCQLVQVLELPPLESVRERVLQLELELVLKLVQVLEL
ncbi:hypothetical protein MCEMSE6_03025 [Oxalobacteraceae bacterium]